MKEILGLSQKQVLWGKPQSPENNERRTAKTGPLGLQGPQFGLDSRYAPICQWIFFDSGLAPSPKGLGLCSVYRVQERK